MAHACTSYRVYLTRSGEIRMDPEPGRCETYWWVWARGSMVEVNAHIEICPECQAWIERCDEISKRFHPGPDAEENLRMLSIIQQARKEKEPA